MLTPHCTLHIWCISLFSEPRKARESIAVRYLVQFGIPALIFLGVVFAVSRRRQAPSGDQDDTTATFLTILVIGAVIAVGILFVLQVNWNDL